MEKVTLICTSLNPDPILLNRMLCSAKSFDSIIVHEDKACRETIELPQNEEFKDLRLLRPSKSMNIPDAYNWLIRDYVKTEWVCAFCDDDFFYPESEKLIKYIHSGCSADVLHFKFRITGYHPWQDVRSWVFGKEYNLWENKPITPQLLVKHNRLPAGSFFRKSAWEKAGGFQGNKCHDWNLWLKMSQVNCEFEYFDCLVYEFQRRNNSAWIRQHK